MKSFSGKTTEDYESWEAALGDEIYGKPKSAKEIKDSRESFINSLKEAVKIGGEVRVESFTTGKGVKVRNYTFKLSTGPIAYSISEAYAIEYCGYVKPE